MTRRQRTAVERVQDKIRSLVPQRCETWLCTSTDTTFGPNPYLQEIWGDDRPWWMCADCRQRAADDV